MAHLVQIDRRRRFTSATLPEAARARLEAAYLSGRWWRDRWTSRGFRDAVRDANREQGGLILLGPALPFEPPPPFAEWFEPVEVGAGTGSDVEALKTISGVKQTREERQRRLANLLAVIAIGAGLVLLAFSFSPRMPRIAPLLLLGLTSFVALVVFLAVKAQTWRGRWFVVPGGLAVVRRPARRGGPMRITVLSRADSCLAFRYVSTGKTTILFAEVWTHAGRIVRRAVTSREAMSLIAAWSSPHAPPDDDRLVESVTW